MKYSDLITMEEQNQNLKKARYYTSPILDRFSKRSSLEGVNKLLLEHADTQIKALIEKYEKQGQEARKLYEINQCEVHYMLAQKYDLFISDLEQLLNKE